MPIKVLCHLLGVPEQDEGLLIDLGDQMIANTDPDFAAVLLDGGDSEQYRLLPFRSPAALQMFAYGRRLCEARQQQPRPDLITALVHGTVGGHLRPRRPAPLPGRASRPAGTARAAAGTAAGTAPAGTLMATGPDPVQLHQRPEAPARTNQPQPARKNWSSAPVSAAAARRSRHDAARADSAVHSVLRCPRGYSAQPAAGSEDKLRDIRSITDAALSYLDADEFLTALLSRVKESLDADTAAVLLLDRSARQLVAKAATGLEEEVRQGVRLPVGQGFAGRIAAKAQPIILDHVDHSNVLNPILLEKGIRLLIGVPLLVNGAVIGVLHVGSVGSRVFTGDDTALLQMAADRAALAVQSLRSREDRAAATALQQSLLPSELPAVPGVEIAARYVPGDGRVGGDWYDVFTLPSGELCLVKGDVAGLPPRRRSSWAECAEPCGPTRWRPATRPRC